MNILTILIIKKYENGYDTVHKLCNISLNCPKVCYSSGEGGRFGARPGSSRFGDSPSGPRPTICLPGNSESLAGFALCADPVFSWKKGRFRKNWKTSFNSGDTSVRLKELSWTFTQCKSAVDFFVKPFTWTISCTSETYNETTRYWR